MQVNAMTEEFEHIEIFGKPVLFTNARVDKATMPEGWYKYDIRGTDYDPGSFGTLEREVGVNHAGTILSPEEIPLSKGKDYRPICGSQNFLGEDMTLAEFCACHSLPIPENPQKYLVRPASPQEAGLFYAQTPGQDEELGQKAPIVGRVSFASGEQIEYTDPAEYLKAIREELPYHATTGFRFETLTSDPAVRKVVDDMVYDLYGEENPRELEDYQEQSEQCITMGGM